MALAMEVYTVDFNIPHHQKSGGERSGLLGGHGKLNLRPIRRSLPNSVSNNSFVTLAVWEVPPSCWKTVFRNARFDFKCGMTQLNPLNPQRSKASGWIYEWGLPKLLLSVKNGCSCISCGLVVLHIRQFHELMAQFKWKCASSDQRNFERNDVSFLIISGKVSKYWILCSLSES